MTSLTRVGEAEKTYSPFPESLVAYRRLREVAEERIFRCHQLGEEEELGSLQHHLQEAAEGAQKRHRRPQVEVVVRIYHRHPVDPAEVVP